MEYDICIVGAGMIGSSAAKYCSIYDKNAKVILIGPDEPLKKDYERTEIFGSYYDQSRITGHLDFDPLWCYLSKQSIQRYREIEQTSGMKFFDETGYLNLFNSTDESFKTFQNVLISQNIDFTIVKDCQDFKGRYPYLNVHSDIVGLLETAKAGIINPRILVSAQLKIARENGVTLLRDTVNKIQNIPASDKYSIFTNCHGTVTADKVIVCAGSFLWHKELLPNDKANIDVKAKLVTAALIPLVENPPVLSAMPSISLMSKVKCITDENPLGLPFSLMAPMKYPNGQLCLKMVIRGGDIFPQDYNSPDTVTEWYRNGGAKIPDLKSKIATTLKHFIPDLAKFMNEKEICIYPCALMETPNYMPYVDKLEENYTLITGCNGNAARSSDEFGRLASKLAIFNEWDCPFPLQSFQCLYKK